MYLQCYEQYLVHTVELAAEIDSFPNEKLKIWGDNYSLQACSLKLLFQTVCFHIGCVFKHCIADLPLDFFINVNLKFIIYFSFDQKSF